MSTKSKNWNDRIDKAIAIRDVLRYFLNLNDNDYTRVSEACVANKQVAEKLFFEQSKLEVPPGAKVAFLHAGDNAGVNGSLLLEFPPSDAAMSTDLDLLHNYVRSSIGKPTPSQEMPRQWTNIDERAAAIVDVLRHFADAQEEEQRCVDDDGYAGYVKDLFSNDPGNIKPPAEIKIVVLPRGQHALKEKGSLVIEIPPHGLKDQDLTNQKTASCYKYWGQIPPFDGQSDQ